jgi:hypothetical protein
MLDNNFSIFVFMAIVIMGLLLIPVMRHIMKNLSGKWKKRIDEFYKTLKVKVFNSIHQMVMNAAIPM